MKTTMKTNEQTNAKELVIVVSDVGPIYLTKKDCHLVGKEKISWFDRNVLASYAESNDKAYVYAFEKEVYANVDKTTNLSALIHSMGSMLLSTLPDTARSYFEEKAMSYASTNCPYICYFEDYVFCAEKDSSAKSLAWYGFALNDQKQHFALSDKNSDIHNILQMAWNRACNAVA
jgi:hypothetical protein